MEITIYGNPVLRKKAKEIPLSEIPSYKSVAEQMLEIMYDSNGIGLAAEQVGLDKQILVIDCQDEDLHVQMVVINPKIVGKSKNKTPLEEGCLSFPGITANIYRPESIEIEYYDLEGKLHKESHSGLLAKVLQHEIDHLNGILIVDRMSRAQRLILKRKLNRLKESQEGELS